jgi:hypothetical protein
LAEPGVFGAQQGVQAIVLPEQRVHAQTEILSLAVYPLETPLQVDLRRVLLAVDDDELGELLAQAIQILLELLHASLERSVLLHHPVVALPVDHLVPLNMNPHVVTSSG